jgi:hypothetical protein
MGCGCKNKSGLTPDATGMRSTWPSPDESGMIKLASAPDDCSSLYHGPFRQATVLVVGIGTESEQLFMRGQRSEAVTTAKANKLSIDAVPARTLCHESMVALLGH